jgi:phosphohistidine phosphatase SixA
MSRRLFILTLACAAAGPLGAANGNKGAGEESFWSALKSGGYIVLLRHAVTEPGIGDPPNFKLGDCGTQRNLSAKGRADAERIGKAFRARGIPVQDVLSSRWCRCIDTAQLAFERVKPEPMLGSMFNDPDSVRKEKARAVFASLADRTSPGNLIMVTHAENIQELTGISPSSGELIVVAMEGADRFKVIGRLEVQSV